MPRMEQACARIEGRYPGGEIYSLNDIAVPPVYHLVLPVFKQWRGNGP
jgi:hypothetical protein